MTSLAELPRSAQGRDDWQGEVYRCTQPKTQGQEAAKRATFSEVDLFSVREMETAWPRNNAEVLDPEGENTLESVCTRFKN